MLDAIEDLRFIGGDASLGAIDEARRARMPGLDAFLPAWIGHLRSIESDAQRGSPRARELARLLSEAAEWHGGADGLGELARARGALDPDAHRDWVDALIRGGRHGDAAGAAGEALRKPDRIIALGQSSGAHLAALLGTLPDSPDHDGVSARVQAVISFYGPSDLARLAAWTGDDGAALDARRERWRAAPSTWRLIVLIDIATALDRAHEVLATEADWALAPERPGAEPRNVANDRLLCELLLLAGRVEQALEMAKPAQPLGWSHRGHPGPIVVPYLLVAATGPAIRPELLIAAGSPSAPAAHDGPLLAQELEHNRPRRMGRGRRMGRRARRAAAR